jgi:YQGE family putative transporter
LLIANAIYALVLPVIEIFVAAYVLRNSHQASKVVLYQLFVYAATPLAFLINGYLLRLIAVNRLYAAGMLLSGSSLVVLLVTDISTISGIVLSGGLMGLATGIFWANRGFLALSTTSDSNRNYYYGVETGVMTVTSVIVPLAIGFLIEKTLRSFPIGEGANLAYKGIAATALLLTIASSAMILVGKYNNPPIGKLVFFRFHPLWYRMLVLAALKGLGQGYIVTAPALLILKFVGREGALGSVESIGSCMAAVCLYAIGRMSGPGQRIHVLAAGLLFFLVGSAINAALFDAVGVLIFMGFLLLAKPLIDLAYYPIQLCAIDVVSRLEGRSQYAYILNHEFGLLAGRFVGCTLFIAISVFVSDVGALKYALLIVAVLQLPAIFVARGLSV